MRFVYRATRHSDNIHHPTTAARHTGAKVFYLFVGVDVTQELRSGAAHVAPLFGHFSLDCMCVCVHVDGYTNNICPAPALNSLTPIVFVAARNKKTKTQHFWFAHSLVLALFVFDPSTTTTTAAAAAAAATTATVAVLL